MLFGDVAHVLRLSYHLLSLSVADVNGWSYLYTRIKGV